MRKLQDLLKKIEQFQEDVRQEVGAELMDLSRLETLLEEFTAPPDVDIPELTQLKKVTCFVLYCISFSCFCRTYSQCVLLCKLKCTGV